MECLLCESTRGVTSLNGVPLCKNCRKKLYRTCSHCKEEKPIHFFYMRRSKVISHILIQKEYSIMCSSCAEVLVEEARKAGLRQCGFCGQLHGYHSSKVDDICESCESSLVQCGTCEGWHARHRTYHMEGGSHLCRKCYAENPGDYLKCHHCSRFHVIDHDRIYQNPKYICTTCTSEGKVLCDVCGGIHRSNRVVKIDGDTICRECAVYKCADCSVLPIRPRRIDDDGAIYCSTCAAKRGSAIKQEWNYCPSKFFFHNVEGESDKLYLGFENEQIIPSASAATSRRDLAVVLAHFTEKDIYGVFDGSIGGSREAHGANGYEIVSHPRTLASHNAVGWDKLFTKAQEIHSTCGMHVHMSRSGFNRAHLLRLMQLIYLNNGFTDVIAERAPNEYTQSIPSSHIKRDAQMMYKMKNNINRRVKVNLCNKHTIELRFYSNVINELSLRKNLEFTHALYYYTQSCTTASVKGFLDYSKECSEMYPNLNTFIEMKSMELSKCV